MQDSDSNTVIYGSKIALQVYRGSSSGLSSFVQAERSPPHLLTAGHSQIQSWEIFTVLPAEPSWAHWRCWVCFGHKIALRASSGTYVQSDFSQDRIGTLHAHNYTKQIGEWEQFEVSAVNHMDGIVGVGDKQVTVPVHFGRSFALKTHSGYYLYCHVNSEKSILQAICSGTKEAANFRFIDPKSFELEQRNREHIKTQQELSEVQAALRAQTLNGKHRDQQIIQLQEELKQFEEAQKLLVSDIRIRDLRKLDGAQKRRSALLREVDAKCERAQHLKDLQDQIFCLEAQLNIESKRLDKLPDGEKLKARFETLKAQCLTHQQSAEEIERLQEHIPKLQSDIRRYSILSQHLPALQKQLTVLEQQLQGDCTEAATLERCIGESAAKVLSLTRDVLDSLDSKVQETLRSVDTQRQELNRTNQKLDELQGYYEQVIPTLQHRRSELERYLNADRAVACTLNGQSIMTGVESLLERAQSLLQDVDQVLSVALKENAVTQERSLLYAGQNL